MVALSIVSPSPPSASLSSSTSRRPYTPTCAHVLAELADIQSQAERAFRRLSRSPAIPFVGPKTPIAAYHPTNGTPGQNGITGVSPPQEYFLGALAGLAQSQNGNTTGIGSSQSRWKTDWEELELLGKGGFGSVVKAQHKLDGGIYAVKKIKLRGTQSRKDERIFREVNTLRRLSHRFIVGYFTTWVENTAPGSIVSAAASDSEETNGINGMGDEDDMTLDPISAAVSPRMYGAELDMSLSGPRFSAPGAISRTTSMNSAASSDLRLGQLDDDLSNGFSRSSFPSIHFENDDSSGDSSGSGSDEDEGDPDSSSLPEVPGIDFITGRQPFLRRRTDDSPFDIPSPRVDRTLYIAMEFVERQTMKERIAEGLSEVEAWKAFHQIVEALVHIASLGILHRDIKLTNIFIDGKGDCKLGDFGLATSSLASVVQSDSVLTPFSLEPELTLEVGTRLYIAPEVQSRRPGAKKGPKDHSKADIYSLGIVFFEMNYMFSTGAERIAVIEDIRKSAIVFPSSWDPLRKNQRQIIEWLLQHDPTNRPTALELSQSNLMPPRVEDEYFKGAIKLMAKPDSAHFQSVLSALFNQPARPAKGYIYDVEVDSHEHTSLHGVVREQLADVFRLHGAVDMEPALLMPHVGSTDTDRALLLDRHGQVVTLPDSGLFPFARLAARRDVTRIKRYHISDVFQASLVPGHPVTRKTAVFDIISPDLLYGPAASSAETLTITAECLNAFPGGESCEIHISHASMINIVLERIPEQLRKDVIDILRQSRSSPSQKRAMMLKKGLLRSTADELEVFSEIEEDLDMITSRLEKMSLVLAEALAPYIHQIRDTVEHASSLGLTLPVFVHPLMLSKPSYFKNGIYFEVIRRKKRTDVLARGGRYDALITSLAPPKPPGSATPICAVAVEIDMDKIASALATYQSIAVKSLIKEQRSFGFWSPRRCDVYVVSHQSGHLQDRMEVAAMLWRNGISADVMYEASLANPDQEGHLEMCQREGILFALYPRPRTARRDQAAFKVKSVLKGTEYELTRQELVGWLTQQIAEQKRIDTSTSGVAHLHVAESGVANVVNVVGKHGLVNSSNAVGKHGVPYSGADVHLLLPTDTKKQRKDTKRAFEEKAFEFSTQIKSAASSIPVLAVDVPAVMFDLFVRDATWVQGDDAWRSISAHFPPGQGGYANQIREAALRRRQDGHRFIFLFGVRDGRSALLTLS